MTAFSEAIKHIVNRYKQLKNKFTNENSAPIEFACIFCQDEKEYSEFTKEIQSLGK